MDRFAGALTCFVLPLLLLPSPATAQTCPEPLASARRLVLVTADGMATPGARMQRFERASSSDPWRAVGVLQSALVGRNGLAWARSFRTLAARGEPIKTEGDRRAPAGFYRISGSFGSAPSQRPNYTRVTNGTVCVDDPDSAAYNTITSRDKVGWQVHGEDMWRVPAYSQGLIVDYPTDRRARAGSCIFIHVRLPSATGTAGCVAVSEGEVSELQDFAEPGAVLAILSEGARNRLGACLPPAN